MRIVSAAALYFAIVFGAGFLLGPIRIFLLEPRIGATLAVLCEVPFLLAAIIWAASRVPRFVRLRDNSGSLLAMGFGALILQQIADLAVGVGLRGLSISGQFAQFTTARGAIYGVLLVLFAIMPFLLKRRATPA